MVLRQYTFLTHYGWIANGLQWQPTSSLTMVIQRIIKAFKDVAPLGEGSGGWESVFGNDREHNFAILTWYYRTDFATRLYKRLLGYEVDCIGGDSVSRNSRLVSRSSTNTFYSGKPNTEPSVCHRCCSTRSKTWKTLPPLRLT